MKFSVIIPTYNRAETVCRAIDSALCQTYPALEIIVVDDGSIDNTQQILTKRYGNAIQYHRTQKNEGVSAARNRAVLHSTGEWIAFLDSDDEWLAEKLERQVQHLQATPLPLCHTDEIWIRNGVRVNPMMKHAKQGGDIFARCIEMCVISPSSVVIRKSALVAAGGFDETLPACEDYDLWLKICANTPVLFIDEKLLIKYGGHDDQLSRKYWGMDRFRIRSLYNLLGSAQLTENQQHAVKTELLKKLAILRRGAEKHHNHELITFCDEIFSDTSKK